MLSDSDEAIRKMAVNKILDARKSHDPNQVRIRVLPSLIVDAKNYHEVIDWDKELITEPITPPQSPPPTPRRPSHKTEVAPDQPSGDAKPP